MTRDEIIRMAKEAGFQVDESLLKYQPHCISWGIYSVQPELERFAALVAEAERIRIANHMRSFVTEDKWQSDGAWRKGHDQALTEYADLLDPREEMEE